MADTDQQPKAATQPKERFFRSRISGLSVVVGAPRENETAPRTVRFTPIWQRWDGEMTKFGYLQTADKAAIAKCAADPNVEEIDQEEYDKVFSQADDAKKLDVRRAAL